MNFLFAYLPTDLTVIASVFWYVVLLSQVVRKCKNIGNRFPRWRVNLEPMFGASREVVQPLSTKIYTLSWSILYLWQHSYCSSNGNLREERCIGEFIWRINNFQPCCLGPAEPIMFMCTTLNDCDESTEISISTLGEM